MVDYLKVEAPDPFGQLIHGGEIAKIDPDGEIEWLTRCKRDVRGSWSGSMRVRNLMADETVGAGLGLQLLKRSGLELDGNPAKFLNGHNLFGTDRPGELVTRTVERVGEALFPGFSLGEYDPSSAVISRIDITGSWVLDRAEDVLPFLDAMRETVFCPYRGKGVRASNDPGTLYYGYSEQGKRAKDWQLKLYSKGREISKRPLPPQAYTIPGLLDEVNRTVRVELTLRTAELKRLGLRRVGDWKPETAGEVWRSYVDRLDFTEVSVCNSQDFAGHLKPRHLDALASWKAGNDLRNGRSHASFYRLRKELRELAGVDIANPVPKSNVVPLRRVVVATPALRPQWADQLTEALRAA